MMLMTPPQGILLPFKPPDNTCSHMITHAQACSHMPARPLADMYTRVRTCSHTFTHVHTRSHMLTYVHTCPNVFTHVHTCAHMLTHVHTCSTWKRASRSCSHRFITFADRRADFRTFRGQSERFVEAKRSFSLSRLDLAVSRLLLPHLAAFFRFQKR